MLLSLLTHFNPSSNENVLLEITYLNQLEMRLRTSIIDYMSMLRSISQNMQGVTIDRIIHLFASAGLEHDRCRVVNSRYLAGDTALVNCDLLQLSGLLSSEEMRQRALGIPNIPPSTTIANRVSNKPINPPQNGRPTPHPPQTPAQSSRVVYPHARIVPWKCIAAIVQEDK